MSRGPSNTIAAHAPGSAGGWPVLAVAAVLILAALGAYWNSFNVPFLLDDNLSIGDNSSIRHLGRIGDVLSPPPAASTAARPLLNLTLALNFAGSGLSVRGYHVVNLLIHICAGLTLLGIVRRTLLLPGLRDRYGEAALPLAAFAALLWTLHPLQTESVTYISQRAESLMGLFYLLTLYGFVRSVRSDFTEDNEGNEAPGIVHGSSLAPLPSVKNPGSKPGAKANKSWLVLSVAACFCGMATKQVMVTAPVLVLLYDRSFVSGSFRGAVANRRWYYAGLAATWLWLGFLMHRSSLVAVKVGFHAGVSWLSYALTELGVVTEYLKLAFWPHPLVFDYGTEILATDPLMVALYALVIGAILVGVVIAWRKSPLAGFLGAWFFLILAPTSTVVPIAEQPMAENRLYLPLAAVVVLVTLLGYVLDRRRAFVVLGIVAVGLGALTVHRNRDYRSELSIWEDTVARQPHTSRGQNWFALALAKIAGRTPDAIAHYEEALRINPGNAEAHNNLAIELAKMPGQLAQAMSHYENALRVQPGFAEAHNNLALELAKMPGRLPDAITHFEEALRLKPNYARAHNNFALALAQLPGRMPDAIAHYEKALQYRPDFAEAHYNYAVALGKIPGRMSDAIAHYEEAVRLKPGFVEARNNLAAAYAETGRIEAAIGQLEIATRLNPASTAIRDNLEKLRTSRK